MPLRVFHVSESLSRWSAAGVDIPVSWLSVAALTSLVALITADLLLITGEVLHRMGVLQDPRLILSEERGFGEMFQYAKFAATGAVLFRRAARLASAAAGILSLVFFYLAADDAFGLHERAGELTGARLELEAWGALQPAHLGELLFMVTLGVIVAGILAYLLRRGAGADRQMILTIGAGLVMLAVPAVGVDLLDHAVRGPRLHVLLGILEEGGELIAASTLAAAAIIYIPVRHPVVASGVEQESRAGNPWTPRV